MAAGMNNNNIKNLSMTFDTTDDQLEDDISTLFDFTAPSSFSFLPHHQYVNQTNNQEHFDITSPSYLLSLGDLSDGPLQFERLDNLAAQHKPPPSMVPMLGSTPIPRGCEEECKLPSDIQLRTSMDPMILPYLTYGSMSRPMLSGDSPAGMLGGGTSMLGNRLSNQDLEMQGENGGLVLPDSMPRVYNSELQARSGEGQHVVHGGANTGADISSLEDPTSKVGKLSVEERKMKICRYKKKRNERNFSKTIKYACRKTLADTRPRVRGRFAKNDEHEGMARVNGNNHEYDDTHEDVSLYSNFMVHHQHEVGMKEEDFDSSDVFGHISGVNSFKCSYPVQSWI